MLTKTKIWMLQAMFAMGLVTMTNAQDLDVLSSTDSKNLFHNYLIEEVGKQHDERVAGMESAMATVSQLEAKQAQLRSDYRMLIGNLPDKTDLNAQVVKTITETGYKIDLLTYESRPDHHVAAQFYYPTTGTGPYPGVLFTVGHYNPESKSKDLMQHICIMLAQNGIAALIVDPICQGERYQIFKPGTDQLAYPSGSGTTQHTMLDVGSMLTGTSVVAYQLWDNIRGLDYLISRPEVDSTKIGNSGDSGGGAQATYLMAYDPRIKVSAVCSYIMDEPTLFGTIGPQTASQNLSYEGYYGIDHPSYITMFAPKPFMIIADTKDFFDFSGSQATYDEVKKVYEKLGAADKISFSTHNSGHGFDIAAKREAAVSWLKKWLLNDPTAVTEPSNHNIKSRTDLQVTTSGNVVFDFADEVVVDEYNSALATGFESDRSNFWSTQSKDSCLSKVKELIMLEETPSDVKAEIVGTIERSNYKIEKIKLTSGNMTPVLGLLFVPNEISGAAPAVLYLDGNGKDTGANEGGLIEQLYVKEGKVVFSIDVRGFGETNDSGSESKHNNNEHRNAVISGYLGKTMIGQRVQDIDIAKEYLIGRSEVDAAQLSLVGIDRAGTAVLHAGALDADFKEIEIRQWTDTSWATIVSSPTISNNMTHVVPSALKYYDLPDLVNAAAPRTVNYVKLSVATLSEVNVVGDTTFTGFDPSQTTFEVALERGTTRVPNVKATATDGGASVSITKATEIPGTTTIEVVAEDGTTTKTYEVNFTFELPLGAKDQNLKFNVYPNPNSERNGYITFFLDKSSTVELNIYDMAGSIIYNLINDTKTAGNHSISLSNYSLDKGMYLVQLKVGNNTPITSKLIVE